MRQTLYPVGNLRQRIEEEGRKAVDVANFLSVCYERIRDEERKHSTQIDVILSDLLMTKHEGMRCIHLAKKLKTKEETHHQKSQHED
jgi:CheY-like chemotaxis protein